jgi:hypothetical protein
MALQDFLTATVNNLTLGQQQSLSRFLADAQSGQTPVDGSAIQAALAELGRFLPPPADADPTDPAGFNTLVTNALANLAGLYSEIDRVESAVGNLHDLNTSELDRIELAVRDLETVLTRTQAAHAENAQWTDLFVETFGADVARETGPEWHTPRAVSPGSGSISSFLPLFVDPEDRSLKLFPGGDFTRSVSAAGDRIVRATLDEQLGLSVDPNHPLDQAVDGQPGTYWRELILAQSPIEADPLLVPWLPDSYEQGAAVRLHFSFPAAVPFTQVLVRPFARFPAQILQAVWDNRKVPVQNLIKNGAFLSGATFWTTGGIGATSWQFSAGSGYQQRPVAIGNVAAASGRATLQAATALLSGGYPAYHLVYKVKRGPGIKLQALVQWYDAAGSLRRADWDEPTFESDQWVEVDKLFNAPSGTALGHQAQLTFIANGSGAVQFTDISFSRTTGAKSFQVAAALEADQLAIDLDNAQGTDLWLVLAQPHYEFLQAAYPDGQLDAQELWQQVRLAAEAKAETFFAVNPDSWRVRAAPKTDPLSITDADGQLLAEVRRLGGRVRDMVVQLLKFARPSAEVQTFNRYLYTLGAWEIAIKHREYAPQGLYVSQPYHPRGEVRELQLLTTPSLSELPDRVRFWLCARATDKLDKARRFTGRATFGSATESPGRRADCHFDLAPVTRREEFDGTDRMNRVALDQYPFHDRERIWTVHTRLTSGDLAAPLAYDPNRETNLLATTVGSGASIGLVHIAAVPGYRPIRVTLQFADGRQARPDLFGRIQKGDVGFSGAEVLRPVDLDQEYRLISPGAQSSIQQQLDRSDPRKRNGLRARLIQAALVQEFGTGTLKQSSPRPSQKVTLQAVAAQTRFKKIMTSPNGVALSLYWHKSRDDREATAASNGSDVLISPARYTVDAENGVIVVRDGPPAGNTQYDSFIAYYYYQQAEGARTASDSRATAAIPTSGIDFDGSLAQALPITRNVTDYVRGATGQLQPSNLDELSPDYYPVYEYVLDDRGRIIFADNFSAFGDRPAQVIVEYESLMIEPRLIVEIAPKALNEFSTQTPILNDVTLLMSSRL